MAWRAVGGVEEEGGVWSVRGLDEGVEEDGVGAGERGGGRCGVSGLRERGSGGH